VTRIYLQASLILQRKTATFIILFIDLQYFRKYLFTHPTPFF